MSGQLKRDGKKFVLVMRDGKPGKRCHCKGCGNPKPKTGRVCSACLMLRWRANHPERAAFAHLKESAKSRHISFNLTFAEYYKFGKRHRYFDRKGRAKWNMTIDRKDSVKGYELGNIRVITMSENAAKGAKEKSNAHVRRALAGRGVPQDIIDKHFAAQAAEQDAEIDCPF